MAVLRKKGGRVIEKVLGGKQLVRHEIFLLFPFSFLCHLRKVEGVRISKPSEIAISQGENMIAFYRISHFSLASTIQPR